jgi:hypothetical protein
MRLHFVMIDFENVQPTKLGILDAPHCSIKIFVGANQVKIPFSTAEALQVFGDRAQYIKMSGNGPNALDFHIAYYIGKLSAAHSSAVFHIVSRDTGFDPLTRHLSTQGISISRVVSVDDVVLANFAAKSILLPPPVLMPA